jgi:hypothetical protein
MITPGRPAELRSLIERGRWTAPTAGLFDGVQQPTS